MIPDLIKKLMDLNKNCDTMQLLFLCGMPGSGKSTVGRHLAEKLGLPFSDLDRLIEEKAGTSIPEIFEKKGEPAFRQLERKLLLGIPDGEPAVIALGGGALQDQQVVDEVKRKGVLIFIDASVSVLSRRLSGKSGRPLLRQTGKEIRSRIEELLGKRRKYYTQSHITVQTGEQPASLVADAIIHKLQAHGTDGDMKADTSHES